MDVRLRAACSFALLSGDRNCAKHMLPHRLSHMLGNVTLDGKYIPHLPVVLPGPLRFLIQGIHELNADPDLVPCLPDAPLENAADVQFPPDLGDGFVCPLLSHYRCPC